MKWICGRTSQQQQRIPEARLHATAGWTLCLNPATAGARLPTRCTSLEVAYSPHQNTRCSATVDGLLVGIEKKLQQIKGENHLFAAEKRDKHWGKELRDIRKHRSACSFVGHSYQLISYDHEQKLPTQTHWKELSQFVAPDRPHLDRPTAEIAAVDDHKIRDRHKFTWSV